MIHSSFCIIARRQMQLPTRGTLRHEHRLYFTTALRGALTPGSEWAALKIVKCSGGMPGIVRSLWVLTSWRGMPPQDISGFFKLPYGGADRVDALTVDMGQPCKVIVPIFRQGQHLRQQPLGFQGQLLVSQMVV